MESVYCAVRTDSLCKADYVSFFKGLIQSFLLIRSPANIAVQWVRHLLHIREVLGSNVCLQTGCPNAVLLCPTLFLHSHISSCSYTFRCLLTPSSGSFVPTSSETRRSGHWYVSEETRRSAKQLVGRRIVWNMVHGMYNIKTGFLTFFVVLLQTCLDGTLK